MLQKHLLILLKDGIINYKSIIILVKWADISVHFLFLIYKDISFNIILICYLEI
jgi:hypothetical protein